MSELIVLLLLCFLGASARNRAVVDIESAPPEINRSEVLPLVIFVLRDHYDDRYAMPQELRTPKLIDGKISYGTQFKCSSSGDQTFFCPRDQNNSQEKCLVRSTFKESEPLRCNSELSPAPIDTEVSCGIDGKHKIFKIGYTICEGEKYPLDPDNIPFYEICYDTSTHKTLYTSHEIRSPGLLNLNFLARERTVDMEYPVIISDGPDFSQHPISENLLQEGATSPTNPSYKLQKMVPPEDMAFATWRRTTYNNLNYEWQHNELIARWDEINRNITSVAQNESKEGNWKFNVKTAIVNVTNPSLITDEQLSNIWIKMVYTSGRGQEQQFSKGTVILMNNFVDKSTSLDVRKTPLKAYCTEDICIDELTKKFDEIGGAILCCRITAEVLAIFGMEWKVINIEELRIPNVTITQDQETLDNLVTLDKAKSSLGIIQPEEMLPLTLLYANSSDYQFPTSVTRIETKNGRIVQGSRFYSKSKPPAINTAYFYPKKDSDDKCLVEEKFGRFQPLECAKVADPIVQKMEGDVKCGLNDSGRIYNVVYQICATTTELRPVNVDFYKVCYDEEKKRNLFTYHEMRYDQYATLLSSKLLLRERAMDTMDYFTMIEDTTVPISSPDEKNPDEYQLRKFVQSEDMAFGIWKKTTYERINADWQHRELIHLWDGINKRIRTYFTQRPSSFSSSDPTTENHIYTGVLDIPQYESQGSTDAQKSNQLSSIDSEKVNVWAKIIYTRCGNIRRALVILMNNFLVSKSYSDDENILREYCYENLCLRDVRDDFKKIGGRIRCCYLNVKIANLFKMQNVNEASAELFERVSDEGRSVYKLSIPHITE